MGLTRDLRDPTILGEALLEGVEDYNLGLTLSEVYDKFEAELDLAPDYASPTHPHDRYGDPRLIPSTLPN